MSHVEAVYRHGVFEPLEPVNLPDEQRVHLSVEPAGKMSLEEWAERARAMQESLRQRYGQFPDSTGDIAADRLR